MTIEELQVLCKKADKAYTLSVQGHHYYVMVGTDPINFTEIIHVNSRGDHEYTMCMIASWFVDHFRGIGDC